ncbi:hypothetical protein ABT160_09225 [Streptomyces sp. NPDC001941]
MVITGAVVLAALGLPLVGIGEFLAAAVYLAVRGVLALRTPETRDATG